MYFVDYLNPEIQNVDLNKEKYLMDFINKLSEKKLYRVKFDSLQKKLAKKIISSRHSQNLVYLMDNPGKFECYETKGNQWKLLKSAILKNKFPAYDSIIMNFLKPKNLYPIEKVNTFSKDDMLSFNDFDIDKQHIYIPVMVKYLSKDATDTIFIHEQIITAELDLNLNFQMCILFKKKYS